jgi:hypothetical protein
MDRLSDAPSIIIDGVLWTCYITGKGQKYIWLTPGKRGKAGRVLGCGAYWSSSDGEYLGDQFRTLSEAMTAASRAFRSKRRAA